MSNTLGASSSTSATNGDPSTNPDAINTHGSIHSNSNTQGTSLLFGRLPSGLGRAGSISRTLSSSDASSGLQVPMDLAPTTVPHQQHQSLLLQPLLQQQQQQQQQQLLQYQTALASSHYGLLPDHSASPTSNSTSLAIPTGFEAGHRRGSFGLATSPLSYSCSDAGSPSPHPSYAGGYLGAQSPAASSISRHRMYSG
ncbi:hypothetical protein BSLG_002840 [Batrachochytrium salamandrivorans]|nr:hypothetical protein BSLG_002840 [Batrachochytrium salamandrivorans]